MTIEEEFFRTFGIEKRCKDTEIIACSGRNSGCRKCDIFGYPEITAENLLQLIVLMFSYNDFLALEDDGFSLDFLTVEEFKEEVLKQLIRDAWTDSLKQKVRKLFEE